MKTRFAGPRTYVGAGLAAAAVLFLCGIAGCDTRDMRSGGNLTTGNVSAASDRMPEEFVQTISAAKPTVVDFSATWCPPCQEQAPYFAEVERQYGEAATFLTVDVDEVPAAWEVYELEGIPTIIIFKNGKPIEKLEGLHSKDQIAAAVAQYAQ